MTSGGHTLPDLNARTERLSRLELDIARAFGWTVILYEESLYERFLQISGETSLVSREEFRKTLREMEAKGYLSSLDLHGHRAYRRLISETDIGVPLTPRAPLEEIKLALGSRRARMKRMHSTPRRVTEEVVKDSKEIGQYVLDLVRNYLRYKYGVRNVKKSVLLGYIEKLYRALCQSEDTFYGFLKNNTPEMLSNLKRIIDMKGTDIVLLGLRLAESDMRRYR